MPCVADRDGAADISQKWRAALAELPLPSSPRPLPWLLLPSAGAASIRLCCFYCGDSYSFRRRLNAAHGARCFGCYEGGWIFLASYQTSGHTILNLRRIHDRKFHRVPLPDRLRSRRDVQSSEDMAILAATLSSSPDADSCVAAGIVVPWQLIAGPRRFAFWRLGDTVAVDGAAAPDALKLEEEVEDVIFYNGALRFITAHGFMVICTPVFFADGGLHATPEYLLRIRQPECLREPVHARYIVESRGSVLLVVRLSLRPRFHTTELKVSELVEELVEHGGVQEVEHSWKELDSLDGRVLYVGRGCSKSFEVVHYPGAKEGIYFMDDGSFYDEAMMFRKVDDRSYPCSDNGMWSGGHIEHCFPDQGVSNHSSPAWLLP